MACSCGCDGGVGCGGCGGCCRKGAHRFCRHDGGLHEFSGLRGMEGVGSCCCGRLPIRVYRAPAAPLGKLRGVIYRSRCGTCGTPHNYVHFFETAPPTLMADPAGTRLYIVGGHYRVTARGIEG